MRAGVIYCLSAYLLWSVFPLYFTLLARSGPVEVIAYRVICSFVFCVLAITALRQWDRVRALLAGRRLTSLLTLSGVLVALNWTTYVYAVISGRTIDAALGYFINPLVSAGLAVLVLHERLTGLQWIAFGSGTLACVVLTAAYGQFPWISLLLAGSFGLYALVKKKVGARVPALAGLGIETAALVPAMLAYLAFLSASGRSTVPFGEPYAWLVYLSGPVTAIPLLLFAAGARRVSLVTVGMIQYLTPIGQFLLGWLYFGEHMPPQRWAGFVLVWVAVVLFAISAVTSGRTRRA